MRSLIQWRKIAPNQARYNSLHSDADDQWHHYREIVIGFIKAEQKSLSQPSIPLSPDFARLIFLNQISR